MTALLIILAILILILIIPFGVKVSYQDEQPYAAVRVLCFNLKLYPAKEKPEKPEKEKKPKKPKKPKKKKEEPEEQTPEEPKKKPSPEELLALAKIGLNTLSRFRRKLTVNSFTLHLVAADEDPYTAAMLFGYVNTALAALSPMAEKAFHVRRSDVKTAVSFEITEPQIDAELTVTISLGRILAVGIGAGMAFLRYKKQAKRKELAASTAGETENTAQCADTKDTNRAPDADERTDKDGTVAAAEPDGGDDLHQSDEDQGDGGC